jgi:hypothetical protein
MMIFADRDFELLNAKELLPELRKVVGRLTRALG